MPSLTFLIVLSSLLVMLASIAAFLIYAAVRYSPIIVRIFEEKPMFLPLRVGRGSDGEDVRFKTSDGLELCGTYLRGARGSRLGVLVFCHEFLSDRWSYRPYADHLRDHGFDIFTFDFRNHGESNRDSVYRPLQWVTEYEVRDLRAALDYVRARPDHDLAGVGLFGVSRGGGTGLVIAAEDPGVWGIGTDGAFPTRGTMLAYILRWAEIYVSNPFLWKKMPVWVFKWLGWVGRVRSEKRLACRFPDIETAAARLAPRPWLMIHGGKDAYIGPDIARALFAEAGDPKESWIVPGAKHNRCREVQAEAYPGRLSDFFLRFAPRAPATVPVPVPAAAEAWEPVAAPLPRLDLAHEPVVQVSAELAVPVSG